MACSELIEQAGFGYSFGALNGHDSDYSYAIKRIACVLLFSELNNAHDYAFR